MENVSVHILKKEHSERYFDLINNNRDSLSRYFPGTEAELNSVESCASNIEKSRNQSLDKKYYLFGIFQETELVGFIQVKNIDWRIPKCEMGYFLDEANRGKGIIHFALRFVINYCFSELLIHKIFARIDPLNIASLKTVQKLGFVQEALHKDEFRVSDGSLVSVLHMALFKENFNDRL